MKTGDRESWEGKYADEARALGYLPHYPTPPESWTCVHCGALVTRPLLHEDTLHPGSP